MDKKSCDKELLEKIIRELDILKEENFKEMEGCYEEAAFQIHLADCVSFHDSEKVSLEKVVVAFKNGLEEGFSEGVDQAKELIASFFEFEKVK